MCNCIIFVFVFVFVFVLFNNAINSDLDFRPRLGFTILGVTCIGVTCIGVTCIGVTTIVSLIVTVLSFLERRGFLSFSSVFLESIIEDFLGIFTYILNVSINLNHFNIFFLLETTSTNRYIVI